MRKTALVLICLAAMPVASALADDIAVTVYNSNLGVVSETRSLDFTKGQDRLAFRDVPSSIDPNSVRFELLDGSGDVSILEQNYAFDLVSADQMYSKYIDQPIELVDEDGELYSGTLLAYGSGTVTLRGNDGGIQIIQMSQIRETNFPSLPDGLITRPTLFWNYNSSISGSREARVSYQTTNIFWSAEYVGLLDKDDKLLDLSGWASINNTSGKTYTDATLKLIAGDINRVQDIQIRGGRMEPMMLEKSAYSGFEEKSFFEYHMYTLPRKATIANKEIKQISLFEPARTSVSKLYLFQPSENATQVKVAVKFTNTGDAGLGMPLPAGRVRLFKADSDGSTILLGEDQIQHTPKDEEVKLTVGYAFDIVAEETTVDRQRISKSVEDQTFEIDLRNRKDEPVVVTVEKRLWGFWEVRDASFEYEKKDATTLTFDITVPAGEEITARYTVRFTNQ
ncbi:DUF4139 domain-containing protein [bacterium]|nr:DUF4139 domain-containing protein [bacterium]